MTRGSHIIIGTLAAAGAHVVSPGVSIWWAVPGAILGSVLPDWDLSLRIPHRTITHGLMWPALLYMFSAGHPLVFGLAIGWLMHILADATTHDGIPPFWPFAWRIRGPIVTGSVVEFVVLALLVCLSAPVLLRGLTGVVF
jgi:inner membrane protein